MLKPKLRMALLSTLLLGLLVWVLVGRWPVQQLPWPVQCNASPPTWLTALVQWAKDHGHPGFQLALHTHNAQMPALVCSAGFTGPRLWHGPLHPTQPMRYASLSKLLTSAAVLQRVQQGLWQTSDRLVEVLGLDGPWADPRIPQITLGQLLDHTAGFDRHRTPDPMFAQPLWCPYHLGRLRQIQLDHTPGSHYAYANVGYCLLGAALQAHGGQSLEAVLAASGAADEAAGAGRRFLPVQRGAWLAGEPIPQFAAGESAKQLLQQDYTALRSSGGWAGTAADFNHWLHATLASPLGQDLLANPRGCDVTRWRHCHGWALYAYAPSPADGPLPSDTNAGLHAPSRALALPRMWWRDGSLPGVTAFAAHTSDGITVTYLAHGRRVDWMPDSDALGQFLYRVLAQQAGDARPQPNQLVTRP